MTTAYSGDGITFPDNSVQATAPRVGMVNRIINGDMRVSQRNGGASVTINTAANTYTLDRWVARGTESAGVYTAQQISNAPDSFINSFEVVVTTAAPSPSSTHQYTVNQRVEGFNISDFSWGTASAKTVTVSFWVYSSLTGTFSGVIKSGIGAPSYPFTYTTSSANTWEYKTVTIPGATTGTWPTDNSSALYVGFDLGSGSNFLDTAGSWYESNNNGATGSVSVMATLSAVWRVTGVQLEKGSTATDFEYVDYSRQLIQCQRYYQTFRAGNTIFTSGAQTWRWQDQFLCTMRSSPTVTVTNITGTGTTINQVTDTSAERQVTTSGAGSFVYRVDLNISAEL